MAYLFGLCYEVQGAMLNELQDVRHSVGTVQVDVALLLADEGLVALWMKQLPCADEVLHDVDVRTRLDVEIARIEESTYIQTRDEFQRFVLRFGGCSLAVQVEMVAGRCLQIAFLEGFAVPRAVAFVHVHVVHVNGNPDIGGGIGDVIVDMLVDKEVVGACLAILDEVDAGFLDTGEVELHVVVFVVWTPCGDIALVGLLGSAVGAQAHECGGRQRLVLLVEFDDGYLRLSGNIANLRESDIRLANPAGDGVRFYGPADNLPRLAGREDAAQHKPAVLCKHASVEELQFCIVAADVDEALRSVGRQCEVMPFLDGQRVDETSCTTVIVGAESLELARFLTVWASHCLTGCIAGQAS